MKLAGRCATGITAVLLVAGPVLLAALPARALVAANGPQPAARGSVDFFETQVRPLLASKCFACHQGKTTLGGLDLSTHSGLMKGGAQGAAVTPGRPEASRLIQAVRHAGPLKMPPTGKLAASEIAILERWVAEGAAWGVSAAPGRTEGASFWAFQRPVKPELPAVRDRLWARTPVDRFILAGLEEAGLKPSAEADRRTLIRRVSFDLTGLPPTEGEVASFLQDRSPDAWEKVIDRLLASPRYGERWGRHWLDVVRYADSNGFDWNEIFPNAWRYRDYVIEAFNRDVPYNRFITEQLAGDLLPAGTSEQRYRNLIATGVLVMGPKLLAQQDRRQLALDVVDEQIDVTSRAFLGLTASCARCHDHKFDPIPTRDYYALAGIFKSTVTLGGTLPRNDRVMYWHEMPLAPGDQVSIYKAHTDSMKKMESAIKGSKDPAEKARLQAELAELKKKSPAPPPLAMAVRDAEVVDLKVHLRGSYKNLGDPAPRGFLSVINHPSSPPAEQQSGRLELARWIASPVNPLTARVMVNRVWQHYFGRGIVPTPDNFGLLGARPTHPELLDWLAVSFVEKGWSLKKLHREILLSSAYRMSSAPRAEALSRDPENRLFWRMNRQRLEAEAIRDAMLTAAGKLDFTMGGTMVSRTTGLAGKEFTVDYDSRRRSVYLPVIRGGVYDIAGVFDFADPHVVTGQRDSTTVPSQALFMMNSPFVREQATRLATLVVQTASTDEGRVRAAYERAFSRAPASDEIRTALDYLESYARESAGATEQERRTKAWESFCHALFSSTEFRFRN